MFIFLGIKTLINRQKRYSQRRPAKPLNVLKNVLKVVKPNKSRIKTKPLIWFSLLSFCLSSLFVISQLLFFLNPAYALDAICAEPGKDNPVALSGIINTYYPGTAATASVGATSITVGAALGATTPITAGDLLLVIQMQDALINSTDTDSYGDGIAGGNASGYTNLNSAGIYQYVVATNSVPLAGGTVSLAQALSVTYTNANADLVNGQRRYQVIRVPQYSSATISTTVRAYAWNGSLGGVVAADVAGSLTFSGAGKIDVSGQGFRGGGGSNLGGTGGGGGVVNGTANIAYSADYRHTAPSTNGAGTSAPTGADNYDGSKGEGIAGSPRWTRDSGTLGQDPNTVTTVTDNGTTNEGYPSGSFGRGAPANAGGGGSDPNKGQNAANTGGGGGANAGSGGRGGDSWTDNSFTAPAADPRRQKVGGEGGSAVTPSVNLIFLGGGGGAATSNNTINTTTKLPSGGGGGGMVIVRSGQILGTGTIAADGVQGVDPANTDGGGGGGAGGTVLIQSVNASTPSISISAKGGAGLNSGYNDHGPGGGGGGGYIAYQGFTPTTNVAQGLSGNDVAGTNGPVSTTHNAASDPYGAADGVVGIVQSTTIPPAQVKPGASCLPLLTVTKTTSTPIITRPTPVATTATYTISVSNNANSGDALNVSISDALPTSGTTNYFKYAASQPATPITLSGGATRPSTTNPSAGDTNPTWGTFIIPPSGQVQIVFNVTVDALAAVETTFQNPATATYIDPTRTSAAATTSSSYDPASSTNEDVKIIAGIPSLNLVKRITAITNSATSVTTQITGYVAGTVVTGSDATDVKWPGSANFSTANPNYLRGAIACTTASPCNGISGGKPGDLVEYTIYFLSNGTDNLTNVKICDRIPTNTTFQTDTYASGQGILLGWDSQTTPTTLPDPTDSTTVASIKVALTNTADADKGQFYTAGNALPDPPCGTTTNDNGGIVVNVVSGTTPTVPIATASGTPINSYGFVRFKVKVN
jgi:uncharacterized repeat protein (TIGR01451 family)